LEATEPAIRHAVLAVASLYEEIEAVGTSINENVGMSEDRRISSSEAVAVKHYTRLYLNCTKYSAPRRARRPLF